MKTSRLAHSAEFVLFVLSSAMFEEYQIHRNYYLTLRIHSYEQFDKRRRLCGTSSSQVNMIF